MRIVTLAPALAYLALISGCAVAPPYSAPPPSVYQPGMERYGAPPPPLPYYEQPPAPMDGYMWTPGYWGAGPSEYFWTPGTWVLPPAPGLLWTPAYWTASGRGYAFHPGYWAPDVGYYGGINYGHGYFGNGYAGGRWNNHRFQYNTAVTNVNRNMVHDTYNEPIASKVTNVTRASYAGGPNTRTQPTPEEAAAAREPHRPPTTQQAQHETVARSEPQLSARRNEGHPPVAATLRPAELNAHDLPQGATHAPQAPTVPTAQPSPSNRHQQQAQQVRQRHQQENERAPKNDSEPDGTH